MSRISKFIIGESVVAMIDRFRRGRKNDGEYLTNVSIPAFATGIVKKVITTRDGRNRTKLKYVVEFEKYGLSSKYKAEDIEGTWILEAVFG